jgi:hypothetical protein
MKWEVYKCKTFLHIASWCTKRGEMNEKSFMRSDTCVEEVILALEIVTEVKLDSVAWNGSAPAEERWEGINPSLGHVKCTLIN